MTNKQYTQAAEGIAQWRQNYWNTYKFFKGQLEADENHRADYNFSKRPPELIEHLALIMTENSLNILMGCTQNR